MKMATKTKEMLLAVLILSAVFSQMDVAYADAADCDDACSTACVQPNTRTQARCERKCQIKCGPDLSAAGGNVG